MEQIEKIKSDLKKRLSEYRYGHSIRVAEEASRLAKFYGCDEKNAYIAGLVHDVAKELTKEENLFWIEKGNLSNNLLNSEFHKILHAEIGAVIVKELYGLPDEIVEAVRYHTVGNVSMTLFDKILFVADKIESGKQYPGIEEERIMAYQNIDKTLILCLTNQKEKLESEGKKFYPDALELLHYLMKNSEFLFTSFIS